MSGMNEGAAALINAARATPGLRLDMEQRQQNMANQRQQLTWEGQNRDLAATQRGQTLDAQARHEFWNQEVPGLGLANQGNPVPRGTPDMTLSGGQKPTTTVKDKAIPASTFAELNLRYPTEGKDAAGKTAPLPPEQTREALRLQNEELLNRFGDTPGYENALIGRGVNVDRLGNMGVHSTDETGMSAGVAAPGAGSMSLDSPQQRQDPSKLANLAELYVKGSRSGDRSEYMTALQAYHATQARSEPQAPVMTDRQLNPQFYSRDSQDSHAPSGPSAPMSLPTGERPTGTGQPQLSQPPVTSYNPAAEVPRPNYPTARSAPLQLPIGAAPSAQLPLTQPSESLPMDPQAEDFGQRAYIPPASPTGPEPMSDAQSAIDLIRSHAGPSWDYAQQALRSIQAQDPEAYQNGTTRLRVAMQRAAMAAQNGDQQGYAAAVGDIHQTAQILQQHVSGR